MASARSARTWVRAALVAYVALAALLVFTPVSYGRVVVMIGDGLRRVPGMDGFGYGWIEFAANVLLFVPLGLLLTLLFRRAWQGALVAVLASVAVELVQLLVPERLASPRDVVANALGAAIGAAVAWCLIIRRPRPARPTATTRGG